MHLIQALRFSPDLFLRRLADTAECGSIAADKMISAAIRIEYSATEQFLAEAAEHPYIRPALTLRLRMMRLAWAICSALFYRLSPRPFHPWRVMLLRIFGAKMGPNCHFHRTSRVWAPWNLICADLVTVGDGAEIYNPAPIRLGSHAILSQNSYLCGATHDYDDPDLPLVAYSTKVGAYAWVCARACVSPGVNIGEGAVLGLASLATEDLEAGYVYAGVPAVKVKERKSAGQLRVSGSGSNTSGDKL